MNKGKNSFYALQVPYTHKQTSIHTHTHPHNTTPYQQVIQSDTGNKVWLWRKWGRVATNIGGNKLEEFGSAAAACQEFEKLYEVTPFPCSLQTIIIITPPPSSSSSPHDHHHHIHHHHHHHQHHIHHPLPHSSQRPHYHDHNTGQEWQRVEQDGAQVETQELCQAAWPDDSSGHHVHR